MHVFLARHLVTQVRPGADTGVVDACECRALDVGGLGQPERAAVHQLEFVRAVVNEVCLAALGTGLANACIALVKAVGSHHLAPFGGDLLQTDRIGTVLIDQGAQHGHADVGAHLRAVLGLDVKGHDLGNVIVCTLLDHGIVIGRQQRLCLLGGFVEGDVADLQHLTVSRCHAAHVKAEGDQVLLKGGEVKVEVLPILGVAKVGIHLPGQTVALGVVGGKAEQREEVGASIRGAHAQHHVRIGACAGAVISQIVHQLAVQQVHVRVAFGKVGRGVCSSQA